MSLHTLNRPGQDNAGGDALANFKAVYSGLIAHQYQPGLKFGNTIKNRTFPRGAKQIELKYHDETTPVYHTPGADVFRDAGYTGNPQKGSRLIPLGAKLLNAGSIDDVDAYMSDFDAQKEHATAIRQGLQRKDDQLSLRGVIGAAVRNGGADEYTNEPDLGATGITTIAILGAYNTTKADLLRDACYTAMAAFDAQDVPDENRYLAIHPSFYPLLFMSTDKTFINRDYGNNNGSTSSGRTFMAAGFNVIRSSNVPTTDLSAEGSRNTELDRDFTNTVGAFYSPEAAVRAVAKDVRFQMDPDSMDFQAAIYVASMVAGYGSWRRECAIWLKGS